MLSEKKLIGLSWLQKKTEIQGKIGYIVHLSNEFLVDCADFFFCFAV